MLRKPGFAGIAIIAVAHMATLMAASNYLAIFLINTMGFTLLQMGLRLVPISIAALVAAPLGAVLAKQVPTAVSLPLTMGLGSNHPGSESVRTCGKTATRRSIRESSSSGRG